MKVMINGLGCWNDRVLLRVIFDMNVFQKYGQIVFQLSLSLNSSSDIKTIFFKLFLKFEFLLKFILMPRHITELHRTRLILLIMCYSNCVFDDLNETKWVWTISILYSLRRTFNKLIEWEGVGAKHFSTQIWYTKLIIVVICILKYKNVLGSLL